METEVFCPKCNECVTEEAEYKYSHLDAEETETVEFTCDCGEHLAIVVKKVLAYQIVEDEEY